MTKLRKNENVNMDIIQKIYVEIKCDISDILKFGEDK
ncbi:helix-turn-helix domain-containing protein [Tyzzerella sp. An114]